MGDLFRRFGKRFFSTGGSFAEKDPVCCDLCHAGGSDRGIDPFLYVYPTGTDAGRRDEESGDRRL